MGESKTKQHKTTTARTETSKWKNSKGVMKDVIQRYECPPLNGFCVFGLLSYEIHLVRETLLAFISSFTFFPWKIEWLV